MARAWIEPADTGWGPVRQLTVALKRLGYGVDEVRTFPGCHLLLR